MLNTLGVNNKLGNIHNISNSNHSAYSATTAVTDSLVMSVFEHQRLTVHDFAQPTDFAWLLAQEFTAFSIKRQRGQWQLKVGHYVGIIMLPSNTTLEILPKLAAKTKINTHNINIAPADALSSNEIMLTRQWLQRMLSDLINSDTGKLPNTKNLGQINHNLSPLPTLMPPLSQWLLNQFLQLLSVYQPTRHYQTETRNQSMLQGKLLIKEQLCRNSTQPHKFACEVSVLSPNMLSNRLIKSALLLFEPLFTASLPILLLSWRSISALNQYELRLLDFMYEQAKRQLATQPLTRQQLQAAQQLLDLAYWLLQLQRSGMATGNSLNHSNSTVGSKTQPRLCLFINMNQAFEQWASQRTASMFTQLKKGFQPLYQPRQVWLSDVAGQACLSIQPDLLIYRTANNEKHNNKSNTEPFISTKALANKNATDSARNCSHVIDIKWKHLSQSSDISASDAYQLLSYAQAYQAEQVWLVYPVTDDSRQPIVLKQQIPATHSNQHSNVTTSSHADLWLMPFNVLTATVNGWPPIN